jgi:N-dimethylarginine dimethylaminohydrolase
MLHRTNSEKGRCMDRSQPSDPNAADSAADGRDRHCLSRRAPGGGTVPLERWGADSEHGLLLDVLLGPIDHFAWKPGNATVRKYLRRGERFDLETAKTQYQEMVAAYEEAGVRVHRLAPRAELTSEVYARDSSVMTPFGPVISQMHSPWRRGELVPVLEFYLASNIPIYDIVTAGGFEGGDFMMIEPGFALLGCSGERTTDAGAAQVKGWLEQEGWEVRIIRFDPFFLHLDVMCVMLADKLAAVATEIMEEDALQALKDRGIEVIDVPVRQALDLGVNAMALGRDRVLLPAESTTLKAQCRALGLEVFDPELAMITKGGGGVHCMAQPLRRAPAGTG